MTPIDAPLPAPASDQAPPLSRAALRLLLQLLERETGIVYDEHKRPLVVSRLTRRLRERNVADFDAYVALLADPREARERACVIDVLTTHETSFFREPAHYAWLAALGKAHAQRGAPLRVLSAAASTGEEAYSAAMVLAASLPLEQIEVVGVDVSSAVVEKAAQGLYPIARAQTIPHPHLVRFCRKGVGAWAGSLLIARELRSRVKFHVGDLRQPQANLGAFDVVFLRNVLIYFDEAARHELVRNVLPAVRRGGHLLVGHSESATGVHPALRAVAPSTYRWEPR